VQQHVILKLQVLSAYSLNRLTAFQIKAAVRNGTLFLGSLNSESEVYKITCKLPMLSYPFGPAFFCASIVPAYTLTSQPFFCYRCSASWPHTPSLPLPKWLFTPLQVCVPMQLCVRFCVFVSVYMCINMHTYALAFFYTPSGAFTPGALRFVFACFATSNNCLHISI
jgi:hypothetical protein